MTEQNWKRSSRLEWQTAAGAPGNEQLQIGCLQRIADASEKMAQNHDQLIRQRDGALRDRDFYKSQRDTKALSNRSLRGQITKLKRELAAARAALKTASEPQV